MVSDTLKRTETTNVIRTIFVPLTVEVILFIGRQITDYPWRIFPSVFCGMKDSDTIQCLNPVKDSIQ